MPACPVSKTAWNSIAGGLDDAAAIVLDGAAQQIVMARQGRLHLLREFLPELGAAFEVGEQERYGARGKGCRTWVPVSRAADDAGGYLTCGAASIAAHVDADAVSARRRHMHELPWMGL